ncbi:YhcH/YjgK/YiaL family protein [Tessaracoccus sp.]
MIIDDLSNSERYAAVPQLYAALEALGRLQAQGLPEGPIHLGEEIGTIAPAEFLSRDPATCRFEHHLTFFDVHCVFEGAERIDVADLQSLTPTSEFDDENDIGFLEGVAQVSVILRPGKFLVCFPEDAHKPGMWLDGAQPIRKVVAKVLV